ncbi:MAG: hypothetical protein H7A23_00165 [Leptospiraceae bacterium]|nr:hypothetical protein [Leptospiraceae bacterium]
MWKNQYTVGSSPTGLTGTGSGLQITDGSNLVTVAKPATDFTFPARDSGINGSDTTNESCTEL